LKRNFVSVGCAAASWLVQAAMSGFLYALAAFVTKEGLERWKSKTKPED